MIELSEKDLIVYDTLVTKCNEDGQINPYYMKNILVRRYPSCDWDKVNESFDRLFRTGLIRFTPNSMLRPTTPVEIVRLKKAHAAKSMESLDNPTLS